MESKLRGERVGAGVSLGLDGRVLDRVMDRVPGRILGLDVGDRRIGVAVSGESRLTAQPVLTLTRSGLRRDLRFLTRLARRYGCAEIVIGNPIYMSGGLSPQASKAHLLAQALQEVAGIPVVLWDERLSTAEAHRRLDEAGRPASGRRDVIDQVAAMLILQSFLDARSARPSPL